MCASNSLWKNSTSQAKNDSTSRLTSIELRVCTGRRTRSLRLMASRISGTIQWFGL